VTDMGVCEEEMNWFWRGMQGSYEVAEGTGKAREVFGLTVKILRGKDSAENLKLVAEKIDELEAWTGKLAIAMGLFGKGGAEMLAFMKDLAQSGDLVVKTT